MLIWCSSVPVKRGRKSERKSKREKMQKKRKTEILKYESRRKLLEVICICTQVSHKNYYRRKVEHTVLLKVLFPVQFRPMIPLLLLYGLQ